MKPRRHDSWATIYMRLFPPRRSSVCLLSASEQRGVLRPLTPGEAGETEHLAERKPCWRDEAYVWIKGEEMSDIFL